MGVSDLLSQHEGVHDDDAGDFMCDVCSEVFKVRRLLKDHSLSHINESPSQTQPMKTETTGGDNKTKVDSNFDTLLNEGSDFLTDIKQERVNFESPTKSHSQILSPPVETQFTTVKTEDLDFITGNRQRASVISGMFNIHDGNESSHRQSPSSGKPSKVSSRSKSGISQTQSNRFFEASDFSNSPDFSSLTDDDHPPFDPFINTKDNNTNSLLDSKNTGDAFAQISSGKAAADTVCTESKQRTGFKGALKHRALKLQKSSVSKTGSQGSVNVSNNGAESARPSVSVSQPGPVPSGDVHVTRGGKHSILQSAITSNLPEAFAMNTADYINSILHKSSADLLRQNLPNKTVSENVLKLQTDIKSSGHGSLHGVLDILKGNSSGSHLKAQLQSSLGSTPPSQSQDPQANVMKSKFMSNQSDGPTSRAMPTGRGGPGSRHKQHTDFSILAQSYRDSSVVPGSMSNTSMHSSMLGPVATAERGGKRALRNLIGVSDPLQSSFLFGIDEHVKDNLGSEKNPEDSSGLLTNF